MTQVTVQSGACGFTVTINAEKRADGMIALTLDTECAMVREMLADIAVLDRFAPLQGFQKNPVFQSAAKHLRHAACPAPSGILKALEVEAGLNLPRNAEILFAKK